MASWGGGVWGEVGGWACDFMHHHSKSDRKLTGENQADYCLLLTQAMDKNDLPLSSDSLIQIAVGYYSNKGDAECKS